jgi:hypothetical protein
VCRSTVYFEETPSSDALEVVVVYDGLVVYERDYGVPAGVFRDDDGAPGALIVIRQ